MQKAPICSSPPPPRPYSRTSSPISPGASSSPSRLRSISSAARIKATSRSLRLGESVGARPASPTAPAPAGDAGSRLEGRPGGGPPRVGEEGRVLARVVGGRRGRVAAVIRRQDQEVVRAELREEVGEPPVEVLQAAVEVNRVVAVPPEHVRLDQVREHEAMLERREELLRLRDPRGLRLPR